MDFNFDLDKNLPVRKDEGVKPETPGVVSTEKPILNTDFNFDDVEIDEDLLEDTDDNSTIVSNNTIEKVINEPGKSTAYFTELYEKGYITEVPEDFDTEDEDREVSPDELIDILKLNLDKVFSNSIKQVQENIISKMSPQLQNLFEYEINGGKDLASYLTTLQAVQNIQDLDPDDEADAEIIIREYNSVMGSSVDEINEDISLFKESGKLISKAKQLKPKLDQKKQEVADKQAQEQLAIATFKKEQKLETQRSIMTSLERKNIFGITLDQDLISKVGYIFTNEAEITLPGNEKVTKPIDEALIDFHKYNPKGNKDALILATLLLADPEKTLALIKKDAKVEAHETLIKENKFAQLKKVSSSNSSDTSSQKQDVKINQKTKVIQQPVSRKPFF